MALPKGQAPPGRSLNPGHRTAVGGLGCTECSSRVPWRNPSWAAAPDSFRTDNEQRHAGRKWRRLAHPSITEGHGHHGPVLVFDVPSAVPNVECSHHPMEGPARLGDRPPATATKFVCSPNMPNHGIVARLHATVVLSCGDEKHPNAWSAKTPKSRTGRLTICFDIFGGCRACQSRHLLAKSVTAFATSSCALEADKHSHLFRACREVFRPHSLRNPIEFVVGQLAANSRPIFSRRPSRPPQWRSA